MQSKFLLIFTICLINTLVSGQNVIPNGDFEDWVNIDTLAAEKPNYWRFDSAYSYILQGYKSPVIKSTNRKSGNFALGLQENIVNNACVGDSVRCTFIFKGRPSSLFGYYRFSKISKANIYIRITLTARDTNSNFYILSQDEITLNADLDWSFFSIPIQYKSADNSYKAEIKIYQPVNAELADSDLVVYLDQFSFSKQTNSGEEKFNNELSAFPNPALEWLYFNNLSKSSQLEIYQLDGRLVSSVWLKEPMINLQALAPGSYLWTLKNDDGYWHGIVMKE